MNKIYSKIWNKNLGQLVVASEHARLGGGKSGKSGAQAATMLMAAAGGLLLAMSANAAVVTTPVQAQDGTYSTGAASATAGDSVAAGAGSKASAQGTTAIGASAKASGINATAVGILSVASGDGSTALGWQAASTGLFAVAIGPNAAAAGAQSIAQGYAASTAAGATNAIALGRQASAGGVNAIALGREASAGPNDAMALGTYAQANGIGAIAAGASSIANADNALALGAGANAWAANSVALGAGSTTTADLYATAYNPSTTMLSGTASVVNGEVSVGAAGKERRVTNIAAGSALTDAVNVSQLQSEAMKSNKTGMTAAIALGGGSTYKADGSVTAPSYSVGGTTFNNVGSALTNLDDRVTQNATTITNVQNSLTNATRYFKANGKNDGTDDAIASGTRAVAVGTVAKASSVDSIAIGSNTDASGSNAVAIGVNSKATDQNALAIGNTATAVQSAIAIGDQANAGTSSTAIGLKATAAGTNAFAGGSNANASGLQSTALGTSAKAIDQFATALGYGTTASGSSSVALGVLSKATSDSSSAFGDRAEASEQFSTAMGATAKASGANSTAVGAGAAASGGNTIAMGAQAKASNIDAIAIGTLAEAQNARSVAVGREAQVTADRSTAFGTLASATAANSVALGDSSVADRAQTVSVGNATTQRQITNMAAGTAETDAVNVSQLKGVTAALGGGAAVKADGTIQSPVYNLTNAAGEAVTAGNVGEALLQLDGRVAGNTTDITNIINGTAGLVQQSAAGTNLTVGAATDGEAVDFRNNAGTARKLIGVEGGDLSAGSAEAVNGSQLFATNNRVSTAEGNITNLQTTVAGQTTNITNLQTTVAGHTTNINNLQTTVEGHTNSITNIDARVTVNEGDIDDIKSNITNGTVGLVKQSAAGANLTVGAATDGEAVDFRNNAGTARKLIGMEDGDLSAGSAEAVNGSQLFATNNNVSGLGDRVTVVEGDITDIQGDIGGINTRISTINTNVSAIGDRVTINEGDINNLKTGKVGPVQQSAAGANLTVGAATDGAAVDFRDSLGAARTLEGVKAGVVSDSSQQAINGSQLHAVSQSVATSLGGDSVVNADGTITVPVYTLTNADGEPETATGVGGALSQLDGRVGDLQTTVDGHTTSITNLTTNLNNGKVGLVQQSAAGANLTVGAATDGEAVDFRNNAGIARKLIGVEDGDLSAGSAEAVNGSQLFTTNDNVAGLGDRVTVVEGDITDIQGDIGGINTSISTINTNVSAIGDRVTINEGDINNLKTGKVGLVQQSAAGANLTVGAATDGEAVDFRNNAGTARKLIGVEDGDLSAGSAEAVNGSQLYATNTRVSTAEGNITNLQTTVAGQTINITNLQTTVAGHTTNINNLQTTMEGHTTSITNLDNRVTTVETNITNGLNNGEVGLVRQDAASKLITVAQGKAGTTVDFTGGEGVRTLTGVKAGGADADAVNVAQLKDVVAGLGGDASVNADGTITAPRYVVEKDAEGNGKVINNVGDAITNIDERTTTNTTAISNLSESLANGEIGLVQQDEDSRDITVAKNKDGTKVDFTGTAGARTLEGVAIGAVNVSSLQAINGSQLYGVSLSMATHLGGGSTVNADGTVSAPSYSVGGTTVNNVGAAISNLDGRTSQNSNDIADLKNGIGDIGGNVTDINNQITTINNNVGGLDNRVTHLENTITNGGFSDSGLVSANVGEGRKQIAAAPGEDSLTVGNAAVASGDNSTTLGNSSQATGTNSVALGNGSIADRDNTVSVGSQGKERQVTNVAAGTQDTDAANVAQLKQSVRYDQNADGSTNYNQVTLGQGAPVTMSNVAKGRIAADSSDAINGSQMYDWTVNRDNKYSNASLSHRVDEVERNMQAGIATALAARQAPYVPGKTTYAVGAAGYKSQGAVGISTRYTAESGRWSLEGGFSKNGDGTGVYVGVSGVLGD